MGNASRSSCSASPSTWGGRCGGQPGEARPAANRDPPRAGLRGDGGSSLSGSGSGRRSSCSAAAGRSRVRRRLRGWTLHVAGDLSTVVYMLVIFGVVALGCHPGNVTSPWPGAPRWPGADRLRRGLLRRDDRGDHPGAPASHILPGHRPGAGIMESLRLSLDVTRGNAVNIFAIGLMTGLVNLAGFLACGVGLIFTIPMPPPVPRRLSRPHRPADRRPAGAGEASARCGCPRPGGPVSDAF